MHGLYHSEPTTISESDGSARWAADYPRQLTIRRFDRIADLYPCSIAEANQDENRSILSGTPTTVPTSWWCTVERPRLGEPRVNVAMKFGIKLPHSGPLAE